MDEYLDAVDLLAGYRPRSVAELADLRLIQSLLAGPADPWRRDRPLHLTASALIVHPPTRRLLLRWHVRQQGWLQVGGHGDPGERAPLRIALREGREETGLADLRPWPDAALLQLSVVPVPASSAEPAHRHADLRFVLATDVPEDARPERPDAPLRWVGVTEAYRLIESEGVRDLVNRATSVLR